MSMMNRWLIPERVDQPELLDLGAGQPEDVRANLIDLWRLNRWLGGLPALTRHLYPRLRAHVGVAHVVDLGTGSAHIPVVIAKWTRQQRLHAHITAVDYSARNLDVARAYVQPPVHLLQANAHHLPFKNNSVDYVISSLFLHHFTPDQVIELLRQAFACARHGIIMSDLVRGVLPLTAFRLVQPILARNYLTRHDGLVSIRRAYTPAEFYDFAQAAGLTRVRIEQHWPWRMTLTAEKQVHV